jgi:CubicO group peptidase (beta-lactamase class C family)
MKRLAITLLLTAVLGVFLLWALADLSPRQLPSGAALATGLGAKLACSGQYLSGFDAQQNADDLATYSALTRLLSVQADMPDGIAASLLGSAKVIARYRAGLGCALEYSDVSVLDDVMYTPPTINVEAPWPEGSVVGAPDAGMRELLAQLLEEDAAAGLDTRALLVVHHERIIGEAYAPDISATTELLGWSMGKSVTAILLGRLEAMGQVSVSEQDLFSAWKDDDRSAISLKNLLQMTSGLNFTEEYAPGSDSTRMLFMSPSASDVAMASPLEYPPGSFWSYSSGTSNLLARLVFERVGGSAQAQLDYITHEIIAPLGLQRTTFEPDASGVFVGSSFIYAPARDWARFAQLLLNGGKINGRRLLAEDWVKRAVQPNDSNNEARYGYQFWLNTGGPEPHWPSLPPSAYAMLGNREQVVMMLPSLQAAIVRLGWSSTEYPVDMNFARIINALEH